ncbi:MAG: hypothetical protein J0H08_05155 [Rhizobiales bacterium]|nr:hypothetical protein [Hyphomicrobiales bacterium]
MAEPEEVQGIGAPPAETTEVIVAEAQPAAAGPQEDAALPEPVAPPVPPPVAPSPPARTRHADPDLPAMPPLTLPGPRNGVPDNLQKIRGIGRKNEELLNSLGIFHFGQIAAWTPAEARWVASHLSFPERIERDDWIGQAIVFATGGDTGIAKVTRPDDGGDAESSVAA